MGKSLKADSCQVTSISCAEMKKTRIPKVSCALAWLLRKQFSIILWHQASTTAGHFHSWHMCTYTEESRTFFWMCASTNNTVLVIKTRSNPTTYQQGTLQLRRVQTKQKPRSDALGIGEVLNSLVRGGLWMAQSLELEENIRGQAVDLQVFV